MDNEQIYTVSVTAKSDYCNKCQCVRTFMNSICQECIIRAKIAAEAKWHTLNPDEKIEAINDRINKLEESRGWTSYY